MKKTINGEQEMEVFAGEFIKSLIETVEHKSETSAIIVGLHGDLGSGKTTFVKAVAKHLGVLDTVTSPTFVIEKIYKLENQVWKHLAHIDAYRLEDAMELRHIGWNELLVDGGNLVMLEWPEKVQSALPGKLLRINFTFISDTIREVEVLV